MYVCAYNLIFLGIAQLEEQRIVDVNVNLRGSLVRFRLPRLFSHVVQRLGYLVFIQAIGVRFPA